MLRFRQRIVLCYWFGGTGLPALFAAAATFVAAFTTIVTLPLLAAATTTAAATTVAAATTAAAATTCAAATTTVAATACAAAATVAATATTTAAAATWAIFTRTGFIDCEQTTAEIFAIQARDGSLHRFWGVHADKRKPTRTTAVTIDRKEDICNAAVLREKICDFLSGGFKGEVPHIHLGIHN